MKNTLLEAYEGLPKFSPASRLSEANKIHQNVFVTEAVNNDMVDVLVDKNKTEVKFRVNGKGRGPEWKFWKDFFESTTGSTQLLANLPFDRAIIRCSTSRSGKASWMKVLGVVSIDPVTKKTKWIPFSMVDKFCKTVGMSPMPTIFKGPLNIPSLKEMIDRPVLGVKRSGIYAIPDGTPTEYIFLPVNVDEKDLMHNGEQNSRAMFALAEEFSIRAFDERHVKKAIEANESVGSFVKNRLHLANESLLLMEYIDRAEKEAGMKVNDSNVILKEAVVKRSQKLWEQYS